MRLQSSNAKQEPESCDKPKEIVSSILNMNYEHISDSNFYTNEVSLNTLRINILRILVDSKTSSIKTYTEKLKDDKVLK
ncbi:hypothetical protein BpHYR1_038144 [Brachionus plicatilis]|uniref:Uncharacterized protein n=1 Tax=Brachionus plicatilis TaxID=10195 RepID=A0A3M7Q9R6_BRAPC|nr:hypothetical protein BpHYR1_038144 [Brachionus plicatilis]